MVCWLFMDVRRKLELMKKYHFPGFGNRIEALHSRQFRFTREGLSPEFIERQINGLYRNLKQVQDSYNGINFDELEAETEEG